MKKIAIGLLACILVLAMAGCGVRQRMEQKAGDALAEKILKDIGVDADVDGDQVVIQGEDGQQLTVGEGKWPTSALAKSIPEFKGGKITSALQAEDSLFILVEEVSEKDFAAYLDQIKKIFAEQPYQMDSEGGMMYSAKNDTGINVALTYEKDAGMSISVTQAQQE